MGANRTNGLRRTNGNASSQADLPSGRHMGERILAAIDSSRQGRGVCRRRPHSLTSTLVRYQGGNKRRRGETLMQAAKNEALRDKCDDFVVSAG